MGDDLSHHQVPRGKKGGKKSKRKHGGEGMSGSDGEGESWVANAGSKYLDELFHEVIIDISIHNAKMDTKNSGVGRNADRQDARRILNRRGFTNRKAMKAADKHALTMAEAFVKDRNNEAVSELPGPRMTEVFNQTRKFIRMQYPEISAKYDAQHWTTKVDAAFEVFKNAYTTWDIHMDAKADGAAAGDKRAKADCAAAADKRPKKKDRKAPASDADIKTDSESEDSGMGKSPKDRKPDVQIQTTGMRVLGIVGMDKKLLKQPRLEHHSSGGSAAPIPTEVVASYPPGVELPKELPMLQAVEEFVQEPVEEFVQEPVKELPVPPAGAAGGSVPVKKEPVYPTDNEKRAAKREQTKLLPSDGFMDLTVDTDSD
jgi:hypothetical protein